MNDELKQTVIEKLQLALSTEMVGYSYYTELIDIIDDAKGKNIFKHLAKEELEHIKYIIGLSDSVNAGRGWIGQKEALSSEAALNAELPPLTGKNELIEMFEKDSSDINAINVAMENEAEAVTFYSEMLKGAEGDGEKEVLTRLVEMEKNHYDLLRWEKDTLTKSGFWADQMEFTVEGER